MNLRRTRTRPDPSARPVQPRFGPDFTHQAHDSLPHRASLPPTPQAVTFRRATSPNNVNSHTHTGPSGPNSPRGTSIPPQRGQRFG